MGSERPQGAETQRLLRWGLLFFSGLVFIAGILLFVLSEQTAHSFAWTIVPPLTAAALGAFYWGSCVLSALSASRTRVWAEARLTVTAGFTFTVLMLLVTLVHLDKFHFQSADPVARGAAWVWLIVYAGTPVVVLTLVFLQHQAPGGDLPRNLIFPGWLRVVLGIQGIVVLALGSALLFIPLTIAPFWPWALTALTGQAIGAWLAAIGVSALQAVWENDLRRTRFFLLGYATVGLLEVVALARYPSAVQWSAPGAWVWVFLLVSFIGVGVASVVLSRRAEERMKDLVHR